MRLIGILTAIVLILWGCGVNDRSTKSWPEIQDRIVPDCRSGKVSQYVDAIPIYNSRNAFPWALADGSFSGIFYQDSPGDPRLLYGRFIPSQSKPPSVEKAAPTEEDEASMKRMQAHWRKPAPDT